jgi:hypothetical protein
MVFVGIDFSIGSPAFCIFSDGRYRWGSVTRSDRDSTSFLKNTKKPHYILNENVDFSIDFLKKESLPEEYSAREGKKIRYFIDVAENLWGSIKRILEEIGDPEVKIAMEGLSFSSNGNALIDISMSTALLRERIFNEVGSDNFYVFSPTSIKKFALKGNSKKDELYEQLSIRENDGTNLDEFCRILRENKSEWITGSKQVNKPIDDLVDATWITLYLISEIKK